MTGRDNVRQYWMRQWGILDPRVEPVAIEEDEGDRTVVRVHQVVRDLAGNAIVDQFVGHVYTIREVSLRAWTFGNWTANGVLQLRNDSPSQI